MLFDEFKIKISLKEYESMSDEELESLGKLYLNVIDAVDVVSLIKNVLPKNYTWNVERID